MSLLDINGMNVTFGIVRAVKDVSLSLDEGEIAGLIGPNGAGKTTFIDALSGFVPAGGTVSLDGSRIDMLPAHRRARAGLIRTWQSVELFDDLTVRDNLRVCIERLSAGRIIRSILLPTRASASARADAALERLGIADLANLMPRELSGGHRQRVGIARALVSDARVILMDEPAAGADHGETAELAAVIRAVADHGVGVLLIEHDMDLVLSITSTLHVLDTGTLIASGPTSQVRHAPEVIAAYLGEPDDDQGAGRQVGVGACDEGDEA
jgi:branched-chain amino acid transport system ATP-binding protein